MYVKRVKSKPIYVHILIFILHIYSSPVLDDDPRCDAIHVSCLQNELNVSAYKLMSTSRCYITIRYVYVDKSKSHIDILFSYIFLNHNLICVCSSINIYNMIKI